MVCIGVIGAMEEEVSSLIQQMEDAESKTLAGMTFYHGTLWNQQAVVVKSGVGKVNMAVCTQILVDVYEVDMVINTGVAGGLYKDINVGDIVISSDALQHDFDVTGLGYERGVIRICGVHFPGGYRDGGNGERSLRDRESGDSVFRGKSGHRRSVHFR